jgi:polysaccharide biosynthesis protein PslF
MPTETMDPLPTALAVLLVGTYPPRHDGLATFAHDLITGMVEQPGVRVRVVAIDPEGEDFAYGRRVAGRIHQGDQHSYLDAADVVRRLRPDIVSVQHEYGLWGTWSETLDADYTIPFIDAVRAVAPDVPVVTTLHTIRPSPALLEAETLHGIVTRSAATVVMARVGAMILVDEYGTPADTIAHIPHGVPVVERRPRRDFKRRLGLEGRTIISTLGMLDRRKGIEYAIAAMQSVVETHPEALYLIVGETHPEVRKKHGEAYRNELRSLVRDLRLENHVRFVNRYLDDRELVDHLHASDVYLTPYLDRHQITSGTLAFAVGAGRAIISTPYPHASEALAEGRGLLAEFRSAESIAHCLFLMLDDIPSRQTMEERMRIYGAQDAWPRIGARYAALFRQIVSGASFAEYRALQPDPLES